MKYGMRERLSGAVILIALAVIFVPMLFDEPAPRGERPEPVLTIEQPIEVPRRDVPDPVPPSSLTDDESPSPDAEGSEAPTTVEVPRPSPDLSPDDEAQEVEPVDLEAAPETADEPAEAPAADPIAELARAADERLAEDAPPEAPQATPEASPSGEWAVQVGSFGESANAERLVERLTEEGFAAYSRPRDNDLTTVYVGPFDSSGAGERAVTEIKERVNLQGLVVKARN